MTAAQLVPDDPLGWYNAGVILYAAKSYNDAAIAFNQAVSLKSDYANALFMLGLALHQLKDDKDAMRAFERVRELNPNDTTIAGAIANLSQGKDPLTGAASK